MTKRTIKEIRLWETKTKNEYWSYDEIITLKNMVFIPTGNPFITRKVKEVSDSLYVLMVKDGKFSKPTGFLVTQSVAAKINKAEEETRTKREKSRANSAKQREKQEEEYLKEVKKGIQQQYPYMPISDIENILDKFQKNSETVGRSSNLLLEEKIKAATIAYVRHRYTDYDDLIQEYKKQGLYDPQIEARKEVGPEIYKIIKEWEGSPEE